MSALQNQFEKEEKRREKIKVAEDLDENKSKPNVKVTSSGLQYLVMKRVVELHQ